MNGRIIALDLGTVRTGLAVSDPTQTIAQPVAILAGADGDGFTRDVARYVQEYEAVRVVVGIPRTMEGRMGPMATWAEGARRRLAADLPVPVEGRDERLSTVSAERALRESGNGKLGERHTDAAAAAILLQGYLEALRYQRTRDESTGQ